MSTMTRRGDLEQNDGLRYEYCYGSFAANDNRSETYCHLYSRNPVAVYLQVVDALLLYGRHYFTLTLSLLNAYKYNTTPLHCVHHNSSTINSNNCTSHDSFLVPTCNTYGHPPCCPILSQTIPRRSLLRLNDSPLHDTPSCQPCL